MKKRLSIRTETKELTTRHTKLMRVKTNYENLITHKLVVFTLITH